MQYTDILKQIFTVHIVQMLIFLCPVVSITYLLKILSIHDYGVYVFAINIGVFVSIICDYGFNLSSTQTLIPYKNDLPELWLQFIAITLCKLIIFLFITIVLLGYLLFSDIIVDHKILYIITILGSIGTIMIPNWFLQAIDRLNIGMWFLLMVRLLNLLFLLLFVHSSGHLLTVIIINALSNVISGFFALVYMLYFFKSLTNKRMVLENRLSLNLLKMHINSNISSFSVNFLATILSLVNNFCLTRWVGFKEAGIYNVADKILFIMISLQNLMVQIFLPHVAHNDQDQIKRVYRFMFYIGLILGIICALFLMFFAKYFILLLAGHKYDNSVILLNLLSLSPIVVFLSNFYYIRLLKHKRFLTVNFAFVLGILYLFLANYCFINHGIMYKIVAVNFVISQIITAVCFYIFARFE
jgi:O-antigen/teichoic acid export membrane protein